MSNRQNSSDLQIDNSHQNSVLHVSAIAVLLSVGACGCFPSTGTRTVALDIRLQTGALLQGAQVSFKSQNHLHLGGDQATLVVKSTLAEQPIANILHDIVIKNPQNLQLNIRDLEKESCPNDIRVEIRTTAPQRPDLIFVSGEPVNLGALEKISTDELRTGFLYQIGRVPEPEFINKLRAAFPALTNAPRQCAEAQKSAIGRMIKTRLVDTKTLKQLDEEEAYDIDDGKDVDFFQTPNFLVKYRPAELRDITPLKGDESRTLWDRCTRLNGMIKPSASSQKHKDVPIRAQEVALIAEESLHVFSLANLVDENTILDMKRRSDGLRIWITIMQVHPRGATGPDLDHFTISTRNDYYANLFAVPHELFHRVQYSYTSTIDQRSSGMRGMLFEGGAMVAEDGFDTIPNCYQGFGQEEKLSPGDSLIDNSDSSANLSWATGLFWKYFSEQCSTNTTPVESACSSRKPWQLDAYTNILLNLTRTDGFHAIPRIAVCTRQPNKNFRSIWMDHLLANRLDGYGYGGAPFRYSEERDPILCPGLEHIRQNVIPVLFKLKSECTTHQAGQLPAWSARYYTATPAPNTRTLNISFGDVGTQRGDCTFRVMALNSTGSIEGGDVDFLFGETAKINVKSASRIDVVAGCTMPSEYDITFQNSP